MELLRPRTADRLITLLLIIFGIADTSIFATELSPALLKAKKEAEGKAYLFAASHDEIVNRAKKEGKLRVIVSLDAGILKRLSEGFTKKYPFIQVQADEIRGIDAYTRQLQELKAGLAKGIDVNEVDYDYYNEYLPHLKKVDMYGMVEQRVLQMPLQMVDPINRNIVAVGSGIQVVAYHKKLIPADSVPDTWEGFLKPEFKDRKFALGIRPKDVAALVPAWGLEKTLDFARKLTAQNPIWVSGDTRTITSMLAGEYSLFFGPNYDAVLRAKNKDKTDVLGYKLVEPVIVRLNESEGILAAAEHPYAALLWLEFAASAEGQKVLEEAGPYEGSVFIQGTVQEKAVRGKKQSLVDWSHYTKIPEYIKRVVEAYGFPRAEK
ncbi:MAG: ABC transporter substrate-binding protein [Deltaproteobacteria bacterium]|nr:MAG: ABC transporter substrate-binding protein [Deltaproteobacteria bacterium]